MGPTVEASIGLRCAIVLIGLVTAGCGQSNPVTLPGTVLVEWDHTRSSRADFTRAKLGARSAKDVTVTVSPSGTPPFELTMHVETAPVDFSENGQPVHQQAPVAIAISVKDNSGWDLSGKCLDGPHYQMPSVGPDGALVTPLGMIQDCHVSHRRRAGMIFKSSWQLGFSLGARGDGTITAFPDHDVKIH